MPIPKRWSVFTKAKLWLVPSKQGIYELGDTRKEVVYIGSSDRGEDIRGRLNFHKNHKPQSVRYFRFKLAGIFESPIVIEQKHCEFFVAEYGRLPRLQKRMPRGYLPLF